MDGDYNLSCMLTRELELEIRLVDDDLCCMLNAHRRVRVRDSPCR